MLPAGVATAAGLEQGKPPTPEDVAMSTIANSPGRTAPDEDGAILDAVGKWLERDVRPHVHALEHDDIYPREMVEQMKALGLFGATIGTAYGGPVAPAHTAPQP